MILPDYILKNNTDASPSITLQRYTSNLPSEKNKITLQQNLFSFLLEGEKKVHYADHTLSITNNSFLLLTAGNCLMTEKLSELNHYQSILLFFDDNVLHDFFLKYTPKEKTLNTVARPVIPFRKDAFLQNYIASLEIMLTANPLVSPQMKVLKLEELLLYLLQQYPALMVPLRDRGTTQADDHELKAVMEANVENNVTVEELAFLCNNSLSTFKRRFAKAYGTSPNKWILQKRMERAASLLLHRDERPSHIYHKVGYENHSSFSQSFKQFFGISPSEYQNQKLNV